MEPFFLWPDENPLAWSGAKHLKKGNNFGCKYSYLYGKSGISRVLTVSIRWCQDVLNWLHGLILGHHDTSWGYISLKRYFGHQIVYTIGVIANFQPKLLPFFRCIAPLQANGFSSGQRQKGSTYDWVAAWGHFPCTRPL